MVVYSDLFFLTIIPIVVQCLAVVYLWKIHKILGRENTLLFVGINGVLILYDVLISFLLFTTNQTPEEQQIELNGLILAFIIPLTNAILHITLQMRMSRSLLGSGAAVKTGEHRNRERDVRRDRERDLGRDDSRDEGRDKGRDVLRDIGRDINRDQKRDVKRDPERDEGRDIHRDVGRDIDKDRMEKHDVVSAAETKAEEKAIRQEERAEDRVRYKEQDRLTRVGERTDNKEEDRVTRKEERAEEVEASGEEK